jgi:hypothetical protein
MADSPAPAPPARPLCTRRSFGVLELLVAMCIVVTLAGMLVPYSERVGERTALTTAGTNLATIAHSFASASSTSAAWMRGSGELPAGAPAELAPAPLDRLHLPGSLGREQRAALLLALQPDPWGNAYLIFQDDPGHEHDESRVVSAGPDRVLGSADDLQQPIR